MVYGARSRKLYYAYTISKILPNNIHASRYDSFFHILACVKCHLVVFVCPHGTIRLSQDGFLCNFIVGTFV